MFCKNCGKELADDMKFCDGCGTATGAEQPQAAPPPPPPQPDQSAPPPPPQPQAAPPQQQYQPPNGQPAAATDNTKLYSILSYISILWIVGLLADPNNQKVKFHVNQGIILSIVSIGSSIVLGILSPALWFITSWLSPIIWLGTIVLAIIGIMNAANDKQQPLPIIGNFTILK